MTILGKLDQPVEFADSLNNLGVMLMKSGNYEQAAECCSKALKVRFTEFQFQFQLKMANVALGKAHTRSTPSLSSLPKVALETVPIFGWLSTDRSRPWRVECRPLPFSTPISFRRSMQRCSVNVIN